MKLAKFLSDKNLSQEDFAKLIGVSQVAINRYVNQARFPRRTHLEAIVKATEGAVQPTDFFFEPDAKPLVVKDDAA